jgi:hypothetical protein
MDFQKAREKLAREKGKEARKERELYKREQALITKERERAIKKREDAIDHPKKPKAQSKIKTVKRILLGPKKKKRHSSAW